MIARIKGICRMGERVSEARIEVLEIFTSNEVWANVKVFSSMYGVWIPMDELVFGKIKGIFGEIEIEEDENFEKVKKELLRRLGVI